MFILFYKVKVSTCAPHHVSPGLLRTLHNWLYSLSLLCPHKNPLPSANISHLLVFLFSYLHRFYRGIVYHLSLHFPNYYLVLNLTQAGICSTAPQKLLSSKRVTTLLLQIPMPVFHSISDLTSQKNSKYGWLFSPSWNTFYCAREFSTYLLPPFIYLGPCYLHYWFLKALHIKSIRILSVTEGILGKRYSRLLVNIIWVLILQIQKEATEGKFSGK